MPFAGFTVHPHDFPQMWRTAASGSRTGKEPNAAASRGSGNNCGKLMSTGARLYWRRGCPPDTDLLSAIKHREADLPAKRTPSQAQARLSRADEDPCRTGGLEAPPRTRPQAAIGLTDGACPGGAPVSPLSLARFRHGLPSRKIDIDPLLHSLRVPARGECRREVGSCDSEECRHRRQAQPSQAYATGGLAHEGATRWPRFRAGGAPRARRGGGVARLLVANRASG